MNLTLVLILLGILFPSWLLVKTYRLGYANGLKDNRSESDSLVGQAEQRARFLEYRLGLHKPAPGDTIHVQDYTTHPPSVRTAICLSYDENLNYVTFKSHGDIYPLTGKYHDGIMVMLDYCQEC